MLNQNFSPQFSHNLGPVQSTVHRLFGQMKCTVYKIYPMLAIVVKFLLSEQLLTVDYRSCVIFTMIQKNNLDKGDIYPRQDCDRTYGWMTSGLGWEAS